MSKVESTIKRVCPDGNIIINKIDPNQSQDFLCIKSSNIDIFIKNELLFQGALVRFIPNITDKSAFANEVEIIQRFESKVKVVKDNGDLIIHKINSKQENDFFCSKNSYNCDRLKEGDKVSFTVNFVKNSSFANELELIKNQDLETNSSSNELNIKFLTDLFLDNLESNLKEIRNGHDFEDFVFFILKSLGIPEIYAVPKHNAGGRADGIFKVSSASTNGHRLEVIYDCTLEPALIWEKKKIAQIENYESQIIKNSININYNFGSKYGGKLIKQTISFNDNADKQIWIITRGETRLIADKQSPDILIKEISIYDLIRIMKERYLDSDFVKADEIVDTLKNLGSKLIK